MTSIAANSANKHLADFSHPAKKSRHSAHRKPDDDDARSEASYVSYGSTSHFSSVLKRPQLAGEMSMSQISYEDAMHNAESNAVTEEERARRRKEEKEQQLIEFQNKTKKSAMTLLQQEQASKRNAVMDQKSKEREKVLKAKEYAKKQREINKQQADLKKPAKPESAELARHPEHHHNHHVQFKEDLPCEAIQEVQEENDTSLLQTQSHPLRVRPASPDAPRFNLAE